VSENRYILSISYIHIHCTEMLHHQSCHSTTGTLHAQQKIIFHYINHFTMLRNTIYAYNARNSYVIAQSSCVITLYSPDWFYLSGTGSPA